MNLLLTLVTDPVWNQYVAWFKIRGLAAPPRHDKGIFVITESGALVSGCCLYTTDGPWFLAEDACADPNLPARIVHMAACITIEQIKAYAAMTGKRALCLPSTQGLLSMLKANGFIEMIAVPVGLSPTVPSGLVYDHTTPDQPQPVDVPVEKPKLKRKRVKKDELLF